MGTGGTPTLGNLHMNIIEYQCGIMVVEKDGKRMDKQCVLKAQTRGHWWSIMINQYCNNYCRICCLRSSAGTPNIKFFMSVETTSIKLHEPRNWSAVPCTWPGMQFRKTIFQIHPKFFVNIQDPGVHQTWVDQNSRPRCRQDDIVDACTTPSPSEKMIMVCHGGSVERRQVLHAFQCWQ